MYALKGTLSYGPAHMFHGKIRKKVFHQELWRLHSTSIHRIDIVGLKGFAVYFSYHIYLSIGTSLNPYHIYPNI